MCANRVSRSDYEVEAKCRCAPSHSNFHGPKGCEHQVIVFRCQQNFYQRPRYIQPHEHDTTCMIKMACRCPMKGEISE